MDNYENEASKFAAQRNKLKNICEAHDLTYEVPGLCKIGADHIICGLPVYKPTASCDKIAEAPPKGGS